MSAAPDGDLTRRWLTGDEGPRTDLWSATLCRIPLNSWSSGIRTYRDADVSCPWCALRLTAIEVATGSSVERIEIALP